MNAHSACGCGKCIPPLEEHVTIYFVQKRIPIQKAQEFYQDFEKKGWRNSYGHVISNWKVHAWEWAWLNRAESQNSTRISAFEKE